MSLMRLCDRMGGKDNITDGSALMRVFNLTSGAIAGFTAAFEAMGSRICRRHLAWAAKPFALTLLSFHAVVHDAGRKTRAPSVDVYTADAFAARPIAPAQSGSMGGCFSFASKHPFLPRRRVS